MTEPRETVEDAERRADAAEASAPGSDGPEARAAEQEPAPGQEPASGQERSQPAEDGRAPDEHAAGRLDVPDDLSLLEGAPRGGRRAVGLVVSRFNGEVTNRLLARALEELQDAGVPPALVTVMPVPGAFELPLAAMALAKTRRFACVIALGCVIRGETPHFDYVAGEAASGLQLAALETGVPVAFGVLTVETREQAEARIDRAVDAVRSGLEMADVFAQLRTMASA